MTKKFKIDSEKNALIFSYFLVNYLDKTSDEILYEVSSELYYKIFIYNNQTFILSKENNNSYINATIAQLKCDIDLIGLDIFKSRNLFNEMLQLSLFRKVKTTFNQDDYNKITDPKLKLTLRSLILKKVF